MQQLRFWHFVKTVEAISLKPCTVPKLWTLQLKQMTIAQVKYADYSNVHVKTFGQIALVSTCFRNLKFWTWTLWTVFYMKETGFYKISLIKVGDKSLT